MAFIAGDRQSDGIFNLWSIAANITIRSLRALLKRGLIASEGESRLAAEWKTRMGIRTPDVNNNILTLSGGNQQKALFARALGSDAMIILMDDPMRGVDIGTKLEVYDMIAREAEARAHLHLVHHRDGRAAVLRPRLCVPQRRDLGKPEPRTT